MRNPFRGLLGRGERPEQEKRLLDSSAVSWPVNPLAAPAAVNEDGALRLGPVLAAGRLLAATISSVPLYTYRQVGDRTQRLPNGSLFSQPCAQGTLHGWVFRAVTSLAYRGNAVGIVTTRDYLEYPTTIEWVNPANVLCEDRVELTPLGEPGSFTNPKWYYLGERLPSEDVVHIPWFQLPGRVWGLSPIGAYAVTVSTGLAAQQFSDDWFRSGGVPPGQFRNTTQTVDQKDASVIKQRLVQAIRSHEPIVYGKDWEYTPTTVSPSEAQFVQTMRMTASQIAAIYGIPPEMIGGETGGSMSYSSPEQRQIELVQFSLLPWLALLESHLSALLPRGQFVKFDADVLVRADMKTRIEAYEKMRLIGYDNIDGIRAMENEAPLPDGAGSDYTPLPLAAGKPVGVPMIRNADGEQEDGRLRLVRDDKGASHG
ncbi:phage portal protein [Streptomyces sp. NPDC051104]|uniref:phage portal protein n=1 Tax=Streptomyces sp. NPDC051104 TaxID=3155044 RepID=UPI003429FF5C